MIKFDKIKKGVALALVACSLVGAASCGSKEKIVVPEYKNDKRVEFCAYASPTNANWDGVRGNADGLTDESYKLMADGGFTTVQPLYDGYLRKNGATIEEQSAKAEQDAMKALALCEKYGLTYCVRDWTFYGFVNKVEPENNDAVLEKMFSEENPTFPILIGTVTTCTTNPIWYSLKSLFPSWINSLKCIPIKIASST